MPCRRPWKLRCSHVLFCWLSVRAYWTGTAQDAAQTYTVRGIVLNSISHQPMARVLVEEQSGAVLTDSNGHFELQLPAQMVTITARRPGFEGQNQGNARTVQVSANMPEVTFNLMPQALITGRIALPDEADATGLRITAYRAQMRHGMRIWQFDTSTAARSDGSFRLIPQQAGTFQLRTTPLAENTGAFAQDSTPRAKTFGYPSIAYPVVSQQSGEGGLRLGKGQQLNVNMVLSRQQFHTATATVAGLPDGVQPNFQLLGEDGTAGQFAMRWFPQTHRVSATVPDGQYSLIAEAAGQMPLFGRADFQVNGAAVTGVNVTVLPLLPIAVNVHRSFVLAPTRIYDRVQGIASLPSSGRTQLTLEQNPGISINLEAADGHSNSGGLLQIQPGSTDNANLQLLQVQPGRYWVQVYAQEGYVSAISSGGVDLAREPLVVGPGGATQPIDITVRNDAGQISCTVHSSAAQSGTIGQAFVYAISTSPLIQQAPQTGMPLNAEAVLQQVPPGTYRVIALDQSINLDDVEKEEMDRYLSRSKTVTVEASGKASVILSLSHVDDDSETVVDDSVPD